MSSTVPSPPSENPKPPESGGGGAGGTPPSPPSEEPGGPDDVGRYTPPAQTGGAFTGFARLMQTLATDVPAARRRVARAHAKMRATRRA